MTCCCYTGSALPPRHLQIHDLKEAQLLGHASPVAAVLPNTRQNSAASLGTDGSLLIWRLTPLQPLHSLSPPRWFLFGYSVHYPVVLVVLGLGSLGSRALVTDFVLITVAESMSSKMSSFLHEKYHDHLQAVCAWLQQDKHIGRLHSSDLDRCCWGSSKGQGAVPVGNSLYRWSLSICLEKQVAPCTHYSAMFTTI